MNIKYEAGYTPILTRGICLSIVERSAQNEPNFTKMKENGQKRSFSGFHLFALEPWFAWCAACKTCNRHKSCKRYKAIMYRYKGIMYRYKANQSYFDFNYPAHIAWSSSQDNGVSPRIISTKIEIIGQKRSFYGPYLHSMAPYLHRTSTTIISQYNHYFPVQPWATLGCNFLRFCESYQKIRIFGVILPCLWGFYSETQ